MQILTWYQLIWVMICSMIIRFSCIDAWMMWRDSVPGWRNFNQAFFLFTLLFALEIVAVK